MKKHRLPWERVHGADGSPDLWRLAVPGGWLVSFTPKIGSPTFFPDPEHDWNHEWCLDTTDSAE